MKLFIESASLEAVEDALDVGAVDGVVLGAAASRQAAKALRGLVDKLVDLAVGPIVIEVAVGTVEEMLSRGREMAGLGDEIVLGLPFTREGLEVCRTCFDEGLATRVAPCFGTAQALVAAKAGATWIGTDVGAFDDAGGDGVKLAEDIVSLLTTCDFETQLLAAGVRHAQHVGELALAGVHSAVITPELLWELVAHPLTEARLGATVRRGGRR